MDLEFILVTVETRTVAEWLELSPTHHYEVDLVRVTSCFGMWRAGFVVDRNALMAQRLLGWKMSGRKTGLTNDAHQCESAIWRGSDWTEFHVSAQGV